MRRVTVLILLILVVAGCSRQVCDERPSLPSPGPMFPHAGILR
ncbi:lipoprotein [Microbulbifer guangxiensis]|nr:lipoprotein [Microbulbifer guangxiensis]